MLLYSLVKHLTGSVHAICLYCGVTQGDIGPPGPGGLKGEKGEKGSLGRRGVTVKTLIEVHST